MTIDMRCKSIASVNKSRAKKFGLTEHFTEQDWRDLLITSEYKCASCGRSTHEVSITADHIVPLARKGTNTIDNIQVLCKSCNSSKHAKTIDFRNKSIRDSIKLKVVRDRLVQPKQHPVVSTPRLDNTKILFKLKEVAESRNINKSQLSLRAQVGIGVVRRYWDDDTTSVDLRILDKFCAVLDCEPSDLLQRTDS